MKPLTLFSKVGLTCLLILASFSVFAGGLISRDAASVIHASLGRSASARGRQLATLQSYLLTQRVTVGLDANDDADWKADSIDRGIEVWSKALSDSPFVRSAPGTRPMIVVKFVDSIDSGGDVQGQVDVTRMLHWGSSVSYKIEGTLLVRRTANHRDLREDELTEVVAHELGHVLGLDDDEECVGLMGPFVPGHARLRPSAEEIQAVSGYRVQLREAIARLGR